MPVPVNGRRPQERGVSVGTEKFYILFYKAVPEARKGAKKMCSFVHIPFFMTQKGRVIIYSFSTQRGRPGT